MKQHSLPMHEENNRGADSAIKDMKSSRELSLKGKNNEDGIMFNPIVQIDQSLLKKHNSLAPMKKESEIHEYKPVNSQEENRMPEIISLRSKLGEKTKGAILIKSVTIKEEIPKSHPPKKIEENSKAPPPEKKWKKTLLRLIDNNYVLIFMTILTIFALFANDVQTAWCPVTVDFPFDVVQSILFCLFTIEIIITCLCKEDYIWSFFFWLDVISTISLIQDISFIFDKILDSGTAVQTDPTLNKKAQKATNTVSKVTSASRATRVLRIIRIIRLIRIVKLYKNAVMARENLETKKKKERMRLLETRIMQDESFSSDESALVMKNRNNENIDSAAYPKDENAVEPSGDKGQQLNISPMSQLNKNNSINNFKDNNLENKISKKNSFNNLHSNKKDEHRNPNHNIPSLEEMKKIDGEAEVRKQKVKEEKRKKKLKEMMNSNEVTIDQLMTESRISKIIGESITKKVIILILAMLMIIPLLSDDFYQNDDLIGYNILAQYVANFLTVYPTNLYDVNSLIMNNINQTCDESFPIINMTVNGLLYYRNDTLKDFIYRNSEIKQSVSLDGTVILTYSYRTETVLTAELNFFRTFFVCICLTLAAIYFEKDSKELVLDPLEVMMEIVGTVAKDPIGAKNVDIFNDGIKNAVSKMESKKEKSKKKKKQMQSEKYEIKVIQGAIIKISALLAIGFGEAGGEIIKENISSHQELNPMLKGKKKTAIFGFCDIRYFPDVNEALQEKTMVFVNEIAEIVHSSVDQFGGAANKNIGDAFLNVWKFQIEKGRKDDNGNINEGDKKEILEIDPNSRTVQRIADMSVLGFLSIIIRINKDLRILAYRSDENILLKLQNFKVKMGFGLHLGWAIEGAIGSSYKIDASYLSPNVNMAARLEAATKQYGVSILLSGFLFDMCSEEIKAICRLIDIVTVKGSVEPVRFYTVDVNHNITPQKPKLKQPNAKEKMNKFEQKKEKVKRLNDVAKHTLHKKSFKELLNSGKTKRFYSYFKDAFKYYIAGQWDEAGKKFNECLRIDPTDGPTKTLLEYIKGHNFIAPEKWKGVRELTSK